MLSSLLALSASTFQISSAKELEIERVFRSLVQVSQPTNLEGINSALGAGLKAVPDSLGNGNWLYGAGMAFVNYTPRGDFRGYSCLKISTAEKPSRSDAELVGEARAVLAETGFWGDSINFVVNRAGSDIEVSAHPSFGAMRCTHDATLRFDKSSGALKSVFMWDRLNYQKHLNSTRVTPSQALAGAMVAYGGFMPYTAAEVSDPQLFFGIPASAELREPAFSEIPAAQMNEFRSYVAMPLYYVDFVSAGGPNASGSRQTVVVDATTGLPLVIYPQSERAGKSNSSWRPAKELEAHSPDGKSIGSAQAMINGKPAGSPVWIKVSGLLIDARYDVKSKQLRIGGEGAYRPDGSLVRYLERNAAARRVFPRPH